MDSTDPPIGSDSDYDSNADEDFNPTTATVVNNSDISSSSDSETEKVTKATKPSQKKRKQPHDGSDLDSGDEATIQSARSKKKHKRRKGQDQDAEGDADADSGGEGGLIKTRAQRRQEKIERQEFRKADTSDVTIDVNAVWAQLSNAPIGRRPIEPVATAPPTTSAEPGTTLDSQSQSKSNNTTTASAEKAQKEQKSELVTIKRSYDFAGQTVSEEKLVHRDSAEAKLYFSSTSNSSTTAGNTQPPKPTPQDGAPLLTRPLKRASLFEPNPLGEVKGLPAHKQRLHTPSRADVLAMQTRAAADAEQETKLKAQKLNTVQKSAIDWAAHVDQQGLKDELDEYGRSKGGYMGKMDFLRNVEGRREEEERRVRLMG